MRNALLCAGALAAGLAVSEAALRRVSVWPDAMDYSATRGWRPRPGAWGLQAREGRAMVRINAGGFRGPEASLEKRPGVVRVAVLGDSFAEAVQVPYEQTFCGRLSNRGRIEVLDFGVSGYGTAQEYLTLREEAWRYRPDVVVLAVCTGNDVTDNSPALDDNSWIDGERCRPYFRLRGDGLALENPLDDGGLLPLFCSVNYAARRSAALRVAGSAAFEIFKGGPRPALDGSEPGLSDAVYAAPATPALREAWGVTERLIAETAHEVRARGADFLAVTLSNPPQVHPDRAVRERYLKAVGGTDLFYPEKRLGALASAKGFKLLALAPMMQAAAERDGVYFHGFPNTRPGSGHWNEKGHQFAADAIARRLFSGARASRSRPAGTGASPAATAIPGYGSAIAGTGPGARP